MLVVYNVYRTQPSNVMHVSHYSVFSLMYSIDNVQASLTSPSLLLFPKEGGGVQFISNAYICTPSQMQTLHGRYWNGKYMVFQKEKQGRGCHLLSPWGRLPQHFVAGNSWMI